MKIALQIKKEKKQQILEDLQFRDFEINDNSFEIWIYNLKIISYKSNAIYLEKEDSYIYRLCLDDIEYFEVQGDK